MAESPASFPEHLRESSMNRSRPYRNDANGSEAPLETARSRPPATPRYAFSRI
jgi:hypothetical protein